MYKTPILVSLFQVTGVLTLVVGAISIFGMLQMGGVGLVAGITTAASTILASLVQFGFAQLIDYVAQIAHNTRPESKESPSKSGYVPYKIPGINS